MPVKAYLPEEYVPGADDRVRLYRRLAAAATPEAVEQVSADLTEAFGDQPEPARDLVAIAHAKCLAAEIGAESVSMVRDRVVVRPLDIDDEARGRLATLGAVYLSRERKLQVPLHAAGGAPGDGERVMEGVGRVLGAILTSVREQP